MVGFRKVGEIGWRLNCAVERYSRGTWRRRSAYFYQQEVAQAANRFSEKGPLPENVIVRELSDDELPQVAEVSDIPVVENQRRLDAGDVCLGVFLDGQLGSVTWIHFGSFFIRGLGFLWQADDRECYEYGAVTDSAFRGQGLYSFGRQASQQLLLGRGIRRSTAVIMEGNHIPERSLLETGFEKTTRIDCIGIGRWRRAVLTNLRDGTKTVQTHHGVPLDVMWI